MNGTHFLKYQWSTPEKTPEKLIEEQKFWAAEYLRRLAGNAIEHVSYRYATRTREGEVATWRDHLMIIQFSGKLTPEAAGLKVAHDIKKQEESEGNIYVPPQAPGKIVLH